MALQRRTLLLSAAAALWLPPAARAQASRVTTVTRLVRLFLDREAELLQAQRQGDPATLERLLADDFEMRTARQPGTPVPRADWLAAVSAVRPGEAVFEQMAAHDHGSLAVVSFLMRPTDTRQAPLFVVDTWVRQGEDWRLQVRYVAPVAGKMPRVPGEADAPAIPKRY